MSALGDRKGYVLDIYSKDSLVSALKAAKKPIAYLVGAPISVGRAGKGVPGIIQMLTVVREYVRENTPSELERYDTELKGKTGAVAYQSAMAWLHANVHQDAVNTVVRRGVLKSCLDSSGLGGSTNPSSDGEPLHWYIPEGIKSLAALICGNGSLFRGPILTPNFDPLLSLAIRAAGGRPYRRVLDTDGSLPNDDETEDGAISVVHLHGYWRGTDTLHTPAQLRSPRPKLKASLQRLLRKHSLLVVAYGGWDDVFTSALFELLHDDQAELDVLWCFRESDSNAVRVGSHQLIERVAPAISRGRFRGYGGIDCHSIFHDVAAECGVKSSPSASLGNRLLVAGLEDGRSQATGPTADEKPGEDYVSRYFGKRLGEALKSFSSQPIVWAERVICKSAEVATDQESGQKLKLMDLVSNPKSTVIKAPPQYGLTCLALYLAKEAWKSHKSFWLYLDAQSLKPHAASIEKAIEDEIKFLGCDANNIRCVVLDSWTNYEKDSLKLLQKICARFKEVPIIVMQCINDNLLLKQQDEVLLDREFEVFYLWALEREQVRKVIADYNEIRYIGDEDSITKRVVSDMQVLNLHRTPLNCLTLLKVSEIDFDESPVNRSEMIKRILFLLFNVDDIPTYKSRPDLKDCEYILGYFCEGMIRQSEYTFTRDHFMGILERCCKDRFIDLEIQAVFDVLYENNIIVKRGSQFCFKFAFWIYYFAAQRMHHDKDFAHFIYEDMRYVKYPEVIEFYTGIDRHREDALKILIKDIRSTCDKVKAKCGLPDDLNPFRIAQWHPSAASLEQMEKEICEGVQDSNLPVAVKDRYADRHYDRTRPYDQEIRDILDTDCFEYMLRAMKAGSTALRNSDYVAPGIKRELLNEILRCWEQCSKVLLILMPLLAERGHASFEGVNILIFGNFGATHEERLLNILFEMPRNVVALSENDLFSQKMGPLLIDHLNNEHNDLKRHELVLLFIHQRPRGWKEQVQRYIAANGKNSFYLFDVYRSLRAQYRYGFVSSRNLRDIEYLIKMAAAKHTTGSKVPGAKVISKISDSVIPLREVDRRL